MRSFSCVIVLLSLLSFARTDCPDLVSRQHWEALDPMHVQYLVRPVSLVVIQNTESQPCSTDKKCEENMRSLQDYYLDKLNYWDIGSSFYVGGNGKIYEGAGWLHIGAHTLGYNNKSIGISFIGNYNVQRPTSAQLAAVRNLIECGVEEGHITQDHHVVGHRQLRDTDSPGRKLYNAIRKWPEWLEDVTSIKN